jgi:acetyl esterase/lipase
MRRGTPPARMNKHRHGLIFCYQAGMRSLALIIGGLVLLGYARAQVAPFAAVARTTMADLLQIPLSDPEVTVKVLGTKREQGLIIEDVVWESLDYQHVPAYVIRPENASGRLPAVIYLHGSSRSRESDPPPNS